jgi:tRNA(Ile)-lysidine synthase TilS/MesJ
MLVTPESNKEDDQLKEKIRTKYKKLEDLDKTERTDAIYELFRLVQKVLTSETDEEPSDMEEFTKDTKIYLKVYRLAAKKFKKFL